MDLKFYVGPKLIRAARMDRKTFLERVPGADAKIVEKSAAVKGYFVQFKDGSYTWMPSAEFNNAYRSLTAGENYIMKMKRTGCKAG